MHAIWAHAVCFKWEWMNTPVNNIVKTYHVENNRQWESEISKHRIDSDTIYIESSCGDDLCLCYLLCSWYKRKNNDWKKRVEKKDKTDWRTQSEPTESGKQDIKHLAMISDGISSFFFLSISLRFCCVCFKEHPFWDNVMVLVSLSSVIMFTWCLPTTNDWWTGCVLCSLLSMCAFIVCLAYLFAGGIPMEFPPVCRTVKQFRV